YIPGDFNDFITQVPAYLFKEGKPGSIESIRRLADSVFNPDSKYDTKWETLAQFGVRISPIDIQKSLYFNAVPIKDELNIINKRYKDNPEDYDKYNKQYKKTQQKLVKYIEATRRQ